MEYKERTLNPAERDAVSALEQNGFHPLTARVLAARGVDSAAGAEALLRPSLSHLHDPYIMKDMDKAVERLRAALSRKETIAVYGDYDADGVTATALMLHVLRGLGGHVISYIPNRLTEGYGLHSDALDLLREQGATLVVTVDTGVTAMEEVARGNAMGMDFIITDHHECRDTLPDAVAVVNPHRHDCPYPFKGLAGVGVAFKLCCALEGDGEKLLADYSDLVAIGTVADVMPATHENRVFITFGLERLSKSRRPGLQSLMILAGKTDSVVRSQDIGFLIAPRINAAGRMGRADDALDALMTSSPGDAADLGQRLCGMNSRRKEIEEQIQREALKRTDGSEAAIVTAGEGWHLGVIGIVAAGLARRFGRPTFLMSIEDGIAKGSARGVEGYNLVKILSGVSHLLTEFGGHEGAAGFSLEKRNLADFQKAVIAHCAQIVPPPLSLSCETSIRPGWLGLDALKELETLEPFGNGFPEPLFCLRDVSVQSVAAMGQGKHSRFTFAAADTKLGAVWFGKSPPDLSDEMLYDIVFTAHVNRFQGKETPQLQLLDMQPSARSLDIQQAQTVYRRLRSGEALSPEEAALLTPTRDETAIVWRNLGKSGGCHSPVAWLAQLRRDGAPDYAKVWVALDILCEMGLCRMERPAKGLLMLERLDSRTKVNLDNSLLLRRLRDVN